MKKTSNTVCYFDKAGVLLEIYFSKSKKSHYRKIYDKADFDEAGFRVEVFCRSATN